MCEYNCYPFYNFFGLMSLFLWLSEVPLGLGIELEDCLPNSELKYDSRGEVKHTSLGSLVIWVNSSFCLNVDIKLQRRC